MEVTTKELRIQPGKILDQVAHGEEVTVTYRGKALARIVPFQKGAASAQDNDSSIFGLWKDHDSTVTVEEEVKRLRQGRQF